MSPASSANRLHSWPQTPQPLLLVRLLALVLVLCLLIYFFRTEQGTAVRAVGSNADMAEAQGILAGSGLRPVHAAE